ncbi:hypothetical protein ACO2Q9_15925 [Variovorax sp. VNK109]|uniref:hypothetical protein n=1 Tax=Variovorax sp. VNK109 TaxID=3400919 RepID=UPI003BFBA4BA
MKFFAQIIDWFRQRSLSDLDRRLRSGPITSSLDFEAGDKTCRQEAWLGLQDDWYALVIEQTTGEGWETVTSTEFRSLDEMARYLAKHTKFVISDF